MGNKTLAIIKPDAVKNGDTGKIYDRILQADFNILSAKLLKMTRAQAEGFYAVHRERPFYRELTAFMSSGSCMVLALEKENAVFSWRETIGATNPEEAAAGTIRKDFGTNIENNAAHGSDGPDTAAFEASYFFPKTEIFDR